MGWFGAIILLSELDRTVSWHPVDFKLSSMNSAIANFSDSLNPCAQAFHVKLVVAYTH